MLTLVCAYLRDLVGWCNIEIILNSTTDVQAVHGDWTLRVVDTAPVDTGSLEK